MRAKNLLVSIVLLGAVLPVSAQTNENVVKIVEQAVRYESAEEIHNFFLNCGFRLLEDEVAQALGAERGKIVYIDGENRLYRDITIRPNFSTKLSTTLTFSSLSDARALFVSLGYKIEDIECRFDFIDFEGDLIALGSVPESVSVFRLYKMGTPKQIESQSGVKVEVQRSINAYVYCQSVYDNKKGTKYIVDIIIRSSLLHYGY